MITDDRIITLASRLNAGDNTISFEEVAGVLQELMEERTARLKYSTGLLQENDTLRGRVLYLEEEREILEGKLIDLSRKVEKQEDRDPRLWIDFSLLVLMLMMIILTVVK